MKGDTLVAATDSCTFKIDSSYSQYTYLEFPLAIISSAIPDSFTLVITTGLNSNPQAGTEIIVDDIAFTSSVTNVLAESDLPDGFLLEQNYPNPFNPETAVSYQLSEVSKVRLAVYDLLGRTAAVLVDETLPAGRHRAVWNAVGHPSGIYFLRLESGGSVETRKMTLVR